MTLGTFASEASPVVFLLWSEPDEQAANAIRTAKSMKCGMDDKLAVNDCLFKFLLGICESAPHPDRRPRGRSAQGVPDSGCSLLL